MMKNPPHPGLLLREEIVVERGISVSDAAARLGLTRAALSRVLNARAAISPNLALRLEKAGVGVARLWVAMQGAYDLAQERQHATDLDVRELVAAQTGFRLTALARLEGLEPPTF